MLSDQERGALPEELMEQIGRLVDTYEELHRLAAGVASQNDNVSDSSEQLQDVLQHTERATSDILTRATHISELVGGEGIPETVQQGVAEDVTAIYEACNFQDVSGQRIKKVLSYLSVLETQMAQLISMVRLDKGTEQGAEEQEKESPDDLKNGPQLSHEALNQDDIDQLFNS